MPAEALIIAGTDTGVGKTVVSAMLTIALDAAYWKPIQSGSKEGTDSRTIAELTGLGPDRIFPERYLLKEPLSPHRAAELDGVAIDPEVLGELPESSRPLIIEAAGGLLVPITRSRLQIDLISAWGAPVVLVARTSLGTINHSLLSIEALRRRDIPLLGVVFVGDANEDNERTIAESSGARRLGRLPRLEKLGSEELVSAFRDNFDAADFRARAYA